MDKKDIFLGIANGIILFLVSFLLSLAAGALGFLAIPVILIVEFLAIRKKLKPAFYATSILVAVILLIWLIIASFQYMS